MNSFVECVHLAVLADGGSKTRQTEASIGLGALPGQPERMVLLCRDCWLRITGAVLSEVAQAAIAQVVERGGLTALTQEPR